METLTKTIIIKPIPRIKFSGLSSLPGTVTVFGCEIGKSGYKTGLENEAEEKEFENLLGLKPGDLKKGSPYWANVFNSEHTIRLFNSKDTIFNLEEPMDHLKYKIMQASSKVCNSVNELHKWPKAQFVIYDEEQEAAKGAQAFDIELEAMVILGATTIEEKRGLLRMFNPGRKGIDSMKESAIKNELSKKLKQDPKEFVAIASDKKLKTKIKLEELVAYEILKKINHYYMDGDDTIASSTEEMVEWLNDKVNTDKKLALEQRLKDFKKGRKE